MWLLTSICQLSSYSLWNDSLTCTDMGQIYQRLIYQHGVKLKLFSKSSKLIKYWRLWMEANLTYNPNVSVLQSYQQEPSIKMFLTTEIFVHQAKLIPFLPIISTQLWSFVYVCSCLQPILHTIRPISLLCTFTFACSRTSFGCGDNKTYSWLFCFIQLLYC